MPSYSVTDGVPAWTSGALTDEPRATAYATARGWTDWAGASKPAREAAIMEASTYVRAAWKPPAAYSETQDNSIQDGVTEAARLALTAPLIGGNDAGKAARKRVKAGSVEVENAEATAVDLQRQRLSLASLLLQAAGAVLRGSGANVRLAKS